MSTAIIPSLLDGQHHKAFSGRSDLLRLIIRVAPEAPVMKRGGFGGKRRYRQRFC